MEIKLKLKDLTTGKIFYKYFETEFEKDKYIRKLQFSNKIIILDKCKEYEDD